MDKLMPLGVSFISPGIQHVKAGEPCQHRLGPEVTHLIRDVITPLCARLSNRQTNVANSFSFMLFQKGRDAKFVPGENNDASDSQENCQHEVVRR